MKFVYIKSLESQQMALADFTDNTNTTGYCDFDDSLPAEAMVLGWECTVDTPFIATAVYTPANPATTIAFVDGGAGADTITDSGNGFLTAGLQAGDTFTVAGATTAGNNKSMVAVNVTAGTITLATAIVTAEAGKAGMTLTVTSTAAVMVGISGDTDKYSANTAQSAATAATVGSMALAADSVTGFSAQKTPRVTITEGTNFGAFDQGSMRAKVYYIDTRS